METHVAIVGVWTINSGMILQKSGFLSDSVIGAPLNLSLCHSEQFFSRIPSDANTDTKTHLNTSRHTNKQFFSRIPSNTDTHTYTHSEKQAYIHLFPQMLVWCSSSHQKGLNFSATLLWCCEKSLVMLRKGTALPLTSEEKNWLLVFLVLISLQRKKLELP